MDFPQFLIQIVDYANLGMLEVIVVSIIYTIKKFLYIYIYIILKKKGYKKKQFFFYKIGPLKKLFKVLPLFGFLIFF